MFSLVVPVSTVFTPGDGAGSVISYWAMVVVATLGFVFALIAVLILIVGYKIEDPEENVVALMAFFVFFVAAVFCFSGAIVFYAQSFPGDSTVEGTVVKVIDVGSENGRKFAQKVALAGALRGMIILDEEYGAIFRDAL